MALNVLAGPDINVGLVCDYLNSDKSIYLKRVFNGGTSTAFIRVQVKELLLKAVGSFEEGALKAQTDKTTRDGLMTSPARLIVAANGTQGLKKPMGFKAGAYYGCVQLVFDTPSP